MLAILGARVSWGNSDSDVGKKEISAKSEDGKKGRKGYNTLKGRKERGGKLQEEKI